MESTDAAKVPAAAACPPTAFVDRNKSGLALIKPEFVDLAHKPRLVSTYLPDSARDQIQDIVAKRLQAVAHSNQTVSHGNQTTLIDGSITDGNSVDVTEEKLTDESGVKRRDRDSILEGDTNDADASVENPSNGPPAKKAKLKGRNKKRPIEKRPPTADKLCSSVVSGRECTYGVRCRFSHDVERFMREKPRTAAASEGLIPGEVLRCYVYDTYGSCSYGITCLFSDAHGAVVNGDKQGVMGEKMEGEDTNVKPLETQKNDRIEAEIMKPNIQQETTVNDPKADEKLRINFLLKYTEEQDALKNEQKMEASEKIMKQDASMSLESDKSADNPLHVGGISSGVDTHDKRAGVTNVISKDLQIRLRKREVDFSRANRTARQVEGAIARERKAGSQPAGGPGKPGHGTGGQSQKAANYSNLSLSDVAAKESGSGGMIDDSILGQVLKIAAKPEEAKCFDAVAGGSETKPVGCVSDLDLIKLRASEKPAIDFRNKLYLAPLTTVGNLPFRRLCRRLGADVTCGEMAMPLNLLQGQASEWALLKRHESEKLFGVQRCCVSQLCGSYLDTMTRATQVIAEHMDVDFIDINVGCPIDLVVKRGEGCALMGRVGRFEQIVRSLQPLMAPVPLTVKMRAGMQEDRNTAHTLLPKLALWNVALATIHGRSREQRYTKQADWKYIGECVKAAAPMPVFGNGDILSYEDYNNCIEYSGVAGCMLARGALVKPWLFTEIKEQRHWDISSSERLDIVREFCNYGLEHWGSDQQGVANTRRFLLEWLSFLHRYIPVGILERIPQRINEKPPYYFGRNDLETLMASSNCADWIKISEMMLGPVPNSFTFLPKHRANAYA